MQWINAIEEISAQLKPITPSNIEAVKINHLLDLTSLNDNDDEENIGFFLEKAVNPLGTVAAVCIYPHLVPIAKNRFVNTNVRVATVVNFPKGEGSIEEVLVEVNHAINYGADEVDLVFPYHRYLAGEQHYCQDLVEAAKATCGEEILLKVILETGVLKEPGIIADASYDVLKAGADFIKTSTGKNIAGASIEAVTTMLLAIKHIEPQLKRHVGIKISGGLNSIEKALTFLQLADLVMGKEWVSQSTFRIGSSKLIDELLCFA